jgi:cystathionine gamma-lyase
MSEEDSRTRFDTRAIGAGEDPREHAERDVVSPIHLATTYAHDEMAYSDDGYHYSRGDNPTRAALEERLSSLEGGTDALATAAGMGAIGTVAMTLLEPGDHVVAFNYLYGGTRNLLDELYAPSFGVDVEYVDATSTDAVADAVTEETKLVWVESPTNPLMKLCDLDAIADVAEAAGATLCVDNTFATPYFQRPLDLGADVVVHSTSKYLNGHSDSLGGAIITRDSDFLADAHFVQKYGTGSVLSPFDSYLVLRGVKTLPARMERHERNATAVAEFLQDHPKVDDVHYPGLGSHPQHDLARDQMDGFGGMLSFEIDGGEAEAARFLEDLDHVRLAVSLGGVESLIAHVATMTHHYVDDARLESMGITDSLVRMSVGIEHTDDILADLDRGLDRI